MFNDLRYKFARFMQGRYGMDQFSRFLSVVLLVLIAVNFFLRIRAIGLLCWAVLFYMYFRIFSRNMCSFICISASSPEISPNVTVRTGSFWPCSPKSRAFSEISGAAPPRPGTIIFINVPSAPRRSGSPGGRERSLSAAPNAAMNSRKGADHVRLYCS